MSQLYYDDSKDLSEGLIIEIDEGVQSQVAQVYPAFRQIYGKLFAAAPEMYEALKIAVRITNAMLKITGLVTGQGEPIDVQKAKDALEKALAKAESK